MVQDDDLCDNLRPFPFLVAILALIVKKGIIIPGMITTLGVTITCMTATVIAVALLVTLCRCGSVSCLRRTY